MPQFDAEALTTDEEGLAFLRDVLGTSQAQVPSRGRFEIRGLHRGVDGRSVARKRSARRVKDVSEAA